MMEQEPRKYYDIECLVQLIKSAELKNLSDDPNDPDYGFYVRSTETYDYIVIGRNWGQSGIRAQFVFLKNGKLNDMRFYDRMDLIHMTPCENWTPRSERIIPITAFGQTAPTLSQCYLKAQQAKRTKEGHLGVLFPKK